MKTLLVLGLLTISINCFAQIKVDYVETLKPHSTNLTEQTKLEIAIETNQIEKFEEIINDSKFISINGQEISADQLRLNLEENLRSQLMRFARIGESGGTGGGG